VRKSGSSVLCVWQANCVFIIVIVVGFASFLVFVHYGCAQCFILTALAPPPLSSGEPLQCHQ